MYNFINNHIEIIAQNVTFADHFAEYLWLKTQYQIGDIVMNEEFKNRYSNFWRLNQARLSQDYKNHYFQLLQDIRNNNHHTITDIVNLLYAEPIYHNGTQRIQFSFSTKLLHTTNNNMPIFDSLIKDFFFLTSINSNLEYGIKRDSYINQYNFLIREYNRIMGNNFLLVSMNYIRETYHLNEFVTDIKIIDSIIWAFVKYLREGNVENGNILFG